MGKPYAEELRALPKTYSYAQTFRVDAVAAALRCARDLPLVAVGSGGSFTTAHFAAALHREHTANLAVAMTPMEVANADLMFRSMAVVFLTAEGKNPDILGAFKSVAAREPARLIVLCANPHSPLVRLAGTYRFADVIPMDLPCGKDGFLATNSLLASALVLFRGHRVASGFGESAVSDFSALLGNKSVSAFERELRRRCVPLWPRENLVVLHGPSTHAAAIDLESKFTEAALGAVWTADYRNFAHGRHHWFAKKGSQSAVVAFITSEDKVVADKTLALLPVTVPVARLEAPGHGSIACASALVQGFYFVGEAGRARQIDPGDPGVPAFGRKIYHLKAFGRDRRVNSTLVEDEICAIERKSGSSVSFLSARRELDFWRDAYRSFLEQIDKAVFHGIVFDYDGTLCDETDRFKGISPGLAEKLNRLARAEIVLGIATGRGKSVRKALRDQIPQSLWRRVVVGYYNGGDVGSLADDHCPNGRVELIDALKPVAAAFRTHPELSALAHFEVRLPQITVEVNEKVSPDRLWRLLQQVLYRLNIPGVTALRSSHSIDVLAPGVSKQAVVDHVRRQLRPPTAPVLLIGDRGQWPGNDFSFLSGPYSLSVDEVSGEADGCWNLSPPGYRGSQACISYLNRIRHTESGFRFLPKPLRRRGGVA